MRRRDGQHDLDMARLAAARDDSNLDRDRDNHARTGRSATRSALACTLMADGESLAAHSHDSPLLLVFLRHLGCTACRQTLADVARDRLIIEHLGARIVLIHMADDVRAHALFSQYGLGDVARVSDPHRRLYRGFGLRRGSFRALFGLRAICSSIRATLRGNRPGRPVGNGLQMPGVILLHRERVIAAFRHTSLADRPDHCAIAEPDPAFQVPPHTTE